MQIVTACRAVRVCRKFGCTGSSYVLTVRVCRQLYGVDS